MQIYNLVVIGGGPAGVSAAIYAKTVLSNVLLIEKKAVGGKINEIFSFDDHSAFLELKKKSSGLVMRRQLLENNLPVEQLEIASLSKQDNLFIIRGGKSSFYSHSVIIATGSDWKQLKLEGTSNAHYKSFSYRVNSDAHLTRGKVILVVGGGYSGCQTADFLSNFAKKVYLIHRGEKFTVDSKLRDRVLENKKIKVYLKSFLIQTRGEKKLESCIISVDSSQKKLEVSIIFPCIGTIPNSQLVEKFVDCTEVGTIKVNNDFQTSTKGLFAAGDVILKNKSQVNIAAVEGTKAAQAVIKYLKKLLILN